MTDLTFNIVALGDAFTKMIALGDSVEKLGIKLDELDRKKADPKIDVDTTAATAKIDELNRKINSSQGLSGGVNNIQTAMIGLGVALGAGALSGGALLAIPAGIAAIGIAAVHSNADVQTAFTGLTTAAKASLTQGFAPFVPTLVAIAGQGKTAISGLTPVFAQAAVAVAPLLQTVSTGLIKATTEGVTGAVPLLQGLSPVAQAIADDFGKVERGAEGLLANLDVSGAANGLSILGTDLEQILPAVGGLVAEVTPLANALLSDLGPALRDAGSDLLVLTPLINGAAAVISFLGPDVAALGPPLLAVMGITKLMTGSWVDFGGAAGKLKSILQDSNGEFDRGKSSLSSLGETLGYTTKATNEARAADATSVLVKAELTKATKEEAVAEAEAAYAADASAKNALALVAAQDELAASSVIAATAEKALAATSEAATFSFGPLGIALAGVGLLLAPFILGSHDAATSAQDLTTGLVQLGQAAPGAAGGILSGNQSLSDLINKAGTAGVNVKGLIDAYGKGPQALQAFTDGVNRQHDALGNQQVTVDAFTESLATNGDVNTAAAMSVKDLTNFVNGNKTALDNLSPSLRALVNQYNAQYDIQGQLGMSVKELTSQQNAQKAAMASSTETQQTATGVANALGLSIGMVTTEFRDLALGTKYAMTATQQMSDTILGQVIAVGTANATITNYFRQADQAASQASQSLVDSNHSYQQSITSVADAEHSAAQSALAVVTARQSVVTAQRSVADAMANVVIAQNNVTKAEVADHQAQVNLNTARQTAIDQLKSMHDQMASQITTEESARVSLFDQTKAAAALGITPDNAAAIAAAPVTDANEAKVNAAIALVKAEDALNSTLDQGAVLRAQVAAADKAGVDGAPGVISAQQALATAADQIVSSQQALVKAHQAASDAQANVVKAEQGVTDAIWNEGKARAAVKDALYNEAKARMAVRDAQVALTKAQDDASRSMDINTPAGLRNYGMLKQVADQLYANEPRLQADNDLIQNTATVFGISKDAAQKFLDKIGLLTAKQYNIDINAVATADLSVLNASYSKILAAGSRGTRAGSAFAAGGQIVGPGTGTSDSIPAITNTGGLLRVSNGEYIVNALSARRNLPLLEMINSSRGYASGGSVDPAYQALSLAALGGLYQGGVDVLSAMGLAAPPSLPPYVAPAGGGQIAYNGPGGVTQWAPTILQALSLIGQPASWLGTVERRMNQESGGNPTVVNRWDSNWAAGTPSVGLMQVIGPTFRGNAGPFLTTGPYEYGVSVDPLANTYAGLHYAVGRYHTLDALNRPGGYDNGGDLNPGWNLAYNGTGRPENVRTGVQEDALLAELRAMRKDMHNLQSVSVAAPQGSSASEVADMVMRRLRFHGRG